MREFTGGPGFMAFVVTFALVTAVILLFRSLSKQLRKVRTRPPEHESEAIVPATAAAASDAEDHQRDGDVVTDEPGDRE